MDSENDCQDTKLSKSEEEKSQIDNSDGKGMEYQQIIIHLMKLLLNNQTIHQIKGNS